MRNVTKELAKAMLEKRNAIASNKDTTEIDIKINALRDFKTKVTEFQTSGSKKKYDAAAELSILKSMIKQRKNSIEEYIAVRPVSSLKPVAPQSHGRRRYSGSQAPAFLFSRKIPPFKQIICINGVDKFGITKYNEINLAKLNLKRKEERKHEK